jgi:tetratricopeptide (TPR) repeat protein
MSGIYDDKNRQAIPRCVDYSTACSLGLLRIIRKQEKAHKTEILSPRTKQEWQNSPSLATAVDLVAEAMIVKNFESEEAIRAACYVLKGAPTSSRLIRELANHFLEQPSSGKINLTPIMQTDTGYEHIARLKKSVRLYPINPIAWSDMALSYATLGQAEKARKAMEVAFNLGRNNRFILRSAARCFMHLEEPDRAVSILNHSDLCLVDPWIISAEIAISESTGLKSKCISKAKNLVEDDNLTQFSRSELMVSVGTVEINSGSSRRAKKLLHKALRDPTENALAQAEWMATQLGADIVTLGDKVPASYEAQAHRFYYEKKFAESLKASEMWGRFQSLSSRPVILSTFLASACLDDDAEALRIFNNSTPAQQNDPLLINNYAFSLARSGDVAAAVQALRKVNSRVLTVRNKLIVLATHGFIYFRTGNFEQGREVYSTAIQEFEKINDMQSAAIAAYFLAVEEKRIGSPHAALRVGDAKSRIDRFGVFALEDLAKRL